MPLTTVAPGVGGTGLTAPGANGNVLTSNGTAWVSSAPAGGGVTSLNGQTGAITTTTNGNIGSTMFLFHNSTSVGYIPGTTLAGSSLYAPNTIVGYVLNDTIPVINGNTNQSNPYTSGSFGALTQNTSGNVGNVAPRGTTAQSGTWRSMSLIPRASSGYDSESNTTGQQIPGGMWVRVS
jgi:hypothetical protein